MTAVEGTVRVLAIDVGVCHLGLVRGTVSGDGELAIEAFALVDVTTLQHTRVPRSECTLPHTREMYDRLCHFEQEFGPEWIEPMDAILIERQPLIGLQSVQDFFFGRYRDRAHLLSPNAMHRFFKINHLDYEGRKERTEAIACHLFGRYGAPGCDWADTRSLVRRHDIADAACLLYYWTDQRTQRLREEAVAARFKRFRHVENGDEEETIAVSALFSASQPTSGTPKTLLESS